VKLRLLVLVLALPLPLLALAVQADLSAVEPLALANYIDF
jgi:hypothetical protein